MRKSEDRLPVSQIHMKCIALVYYCQLGMLLCYVYDLALERRELRPVQKEKEKKTHTHLHTKEAAHVIKMNSGKETYQK